MSRVLCPYSTFAIFPVGASQRNRTGLPRDFPPPIRPPRFIWHPPRAWLRSFGHVVLLSACTVRCVRCLPTMSVMYVEYIAYIARNWCWQSANIVVTSRPIAEDRQGHRRCVGVGVSDGSDGSAGHKMGGTFSIFLIRPHSIRCLQCTQKSADTGQFLYMYN